MPDNIYQIFVLKDPRTGEARYVGHSRNPELRFRQLLEDAKRNELREWIAGLLGEGLVPEMTIVEEATSPRTAKKRLARSLREQGYALIRDEDLPRGPYHTSERIKAMRRRIVREKMIPALRAALEERTAKRIQRLLDSDYDRLTSHEVCEMLQCTIPTALKYLKILIEHHGWDRQFVAPKGGLGRHRLVAIRPEKGDSNG